MKPGDLIRVNEHLLGGDGSLFAIYLGEIRDPHYGTLARVLLTSRKITNLHFAHLREL